MRLFFFIIIITSHFFSVAQLSVRPSDASIALQAITFNGGQAPFWSWANQDGIIDYHSQSLQFYGEIHKEFDSLFTQRRELKSTSWGYGFMAVASLENQSRLLLPEAYLKFRWKKLELSAGRRFISADPLRKDRELGKLMWGANSLPIPEIRLALPEFTPITKRGLLAIKGGYSHGWFGSTDSVKHYFLHQKSLYVRIGKPAWRMHFFGGANHQVQWGGRPTNPFYDELNNQIVTKYPDNFNSYLKVVSGISLNRRNYGRKIEEIPSSDAQNRIGNHLGTVDIGLTFDANFAKFLIYRQSYFEDGSLFYLSNLKDGLLGVNVDLRSKSETHFSIRKLIFDYLDSRNQGGEGDSRNTIPQLRGKDNYFNNGIYKDGWTYRNNFIGLPLIIPAIAISSKENKNLPDAMLVNNRLQAGILTVNGQINNHFWSIRQVFSRNLGTYGYPLNNLKQYSLSLNFQQHFASGMSSTYSINMDQGDVLGNQFGIVVSVKQPLIH